MEIAQDKIVHRSRSKASVVSCLAFFALLIAVPVAVFGEPTTPQHHHGPPPTHEYSLFMHHSSGLALVLLGLLVLADRLTRARFTAIRVAIGLLWVVFGTHLFIRSDPEGWPVGPASLLESFSMPTRAEWVQHKLLSLIPIALGIWTFISRRVGPTAPQSYAVAAMAGLGAAGLLFHHHLDHPVLDFVNLQHRFLAATSLFIAGSMALDGRTEEMNRYEPFLLPTGLVIMGIQLILYVE